MVSCAHCGASNRMGSPFCESCWRILETSGPAAAAASMPPPPPPPRIGSVMTPAFAGAPAAAAPVFAPQSAAPVFAADGGLISTAPAVEEPAKWWWSHIIVVGLLAWGIPIMHAIAQARSFNSSTTFNGMIEGGLMVQILGHVLAAIAVVGLIKWHHKGNWEALGLSFSDIAYDKVLKGGAFGAGMLLAWLPLGFMLQGRGMEVDPQSQMLIGGTTSFGLLLALVVIVVGAPIVEEIYFRGMLFDKLMPIGLPLTMVITSMLFVRAHGAWIIPPLIGFAFAMAWKRHTNGLWYTIGAHAAWNLSVCLLAAFVLFGATRVFTPSDGAYTIRHPSTWQRVEEAEGSVPAVASIDLALQGPQASMVVAGRMMKPPIEGLTPKRTLKELLGTMQTFAGQTGVLQPAAPVRSPRSFDGTTWAYEVTNQVTGPDGTTGTIKSLALIPSGWNDVLFVMYFCPSFSCEDGNKEFDTMLGSLSMS